MSIHAMSEIPQMITPHGANNMALPGNGDLHNNSHNNLMTSRLEELHEQHYGDHELKLFKQASSEMDFPAQVTDINQHFLDANEFTDHM